MAGDWIKMRTDLLTSPKVVRMTSALNADRFRIVGGLLSVWSLFDAHSDDGVLHGYTLKAVDELAAWPGFSAAMESVGWIVSDDESLSLPRFDTHNGQSAKRRAQEADRKRNVRKASASDADKTRTRGEERREDTKQELASLAPGERAAPTNAGRACVLMRKAGCVSTNPSHPDLLAALSEGVTPEALAATAAEGVEGGKAKPFAWAITTARSRHKQGAAPVTGANRNEAGGRLSAVERIEANIRRNRAEGREGGFIDAESVRLPR